MKLAMHVIKYNKSMYKFIARKHKHEIKIKGGEGLVRTCEVYTMPVVQSIHVSLHNKILIKLGGWRI